MKATLMHMMMKYPILWDTNHIHYFSKEKSKYWNQLLNDINAYYTPGLTLQQLKKKVIYVRSIQLKNENASTSQANNAETVSFQKDPMTKKRTDDTDQYMAKKKKRDVEILKTIPNAASACSHGSNGGKSDATVKLAVCRICLSDKEQLMVITNKELQRVYQKLTLLPFNTSDARPQTACLTCINRLRTAHKLMADSLLSEEWFTYTLAGVDLNKTVEPSSSKLSVVDIPSLTISSNQPEAHESIDINEASVGEGSKTDCAIHNSEDTSLSMHCGISDSVVPKTEYIPPSDEHTPGHSDTTSNDNHLIYNVVKEELDLEEMDVSNDVSGHTDQQVVDNVANNTLNSERINKRAVAYSNLRTCSKEVRRDLPHVYPFGIHVNMIVESGVGKSASESLLSENVGKERIVEPITYNYIDSEQPGTNNALSSSSKEVGCDLRHMYPFGMNVNIKAELENEKSTSESLISENVGKERLVDANTHNYNNALCGSSKEVGRDLPHGYTFGINVNMKAESEDEKTTSESPNSENVGKDRIVVPKPYILDSGQPCGSNDDDSESDEEILKIVDYF